MTTCERCPQPRTRQLAGEYLCDDCAEDILRPIRERVARHMAPEGFDGVGHTTTPATDWGTGWFDLACDQCAATWVGRDGEACGWCAGRYERMLVEQKRLLLHPELPDTDDERRADALIAWRGRLKNAATADVISEHEARNAYEREVPRVAA